MTGRALAGETARTGEADAPRPADRAAGRDRRATDAGAAQAAITVRGLRKSYGATSVLRGVDLDAPAGLVTAVLGASGSGKTTLLRLIAGFDTADAGRIGIGGQIVDDAGRAVPARRRRVGYVPQDAALFPHLTVAGNVGFGVARRQRPARVAELLALVGLPGYQRRYPNQLSGGQQQRVALARALAIQPRVVLLDEPFGALDAALRDTVRTEVLGILARAGTTTILVTHDQDEALSLADHVVLLHDGHVTAHGSPEQLYERPPSPDAATSIGTANILAGRLEPGGGVRCALGLLPVADLGGDRDGADHEDGGGAAARPGGCRLLLRPEQLRLTAAPVPGARPVAVAGIRYHGHDTLVDVVVDGPAAGWSDIGSERGAFGLTARVAGPTALRPGQDAWMSVTGAVHAWRADAGQAPQA